MSDNFELVSVCEFCGQTFICNETDDKETYGIEHCKCNEAVVWRKRQQKIAEAKVNLHDVFSANLFGTSASDDSKIQEIEEIIEKLIPYLVHEHIWKFSFDIPEFGKVGVSLSADNGVKIKRTLTNSVQRSS